MTGRRDQASLGHLENSNFAVQALGTLARIYQSRGDADGQFRAFSRLAWLRPDDRDIANNLAYFAAVTGQANRTMVARIAKDNFESQPDNVTYRSTWAFVLCNLARPKEAMDVLQPVVSGWKTSRPIAWAYVAALAGIGQREEARKVLRTSPIDPRLLSAQEINWMRAALL